MRKFEAVYYDGVSTRPHAVRVSLDAEGSLRILGEETDLAFARAELRIAPRLGNAPRSIALPEGRKLETTDNDAIDALSGSTGLALVQWLESRWSVVVASVIGLVVLFAGAFAYGVPVLAKLVAERVPDAIAHRLGKDTLLLLDETAFDESTLDEERRVRLRGRFAALAGHHADLPLELEFRSLGMPNAFAFPDGTVVVADELVELAEDDEIAAVLAHEIGHVHHRHGLRMVLESSSVALLVSAWVGDVGQISTVLAGLPAVYSQAGYSRAHETEADDFAYELMETAGIEHRHFAGALRKLQAATKHREEGPMRYFSTHPPTDERIERFDPTASAASPR